MIVPEYWAEAKCRDIIDGSQLTIQRFGWSDVSQAEANSNAHERAQEAMTRARNGEKVRKIDHKVSYNGAEGLPIREEIISRHGDVVITRNVYGALCLNSPDVLFADIDSLIKEYEPGWKLFVLLSVISLSTAYLYFNKLSLAIPILLVAHFFLVPLLVNLFMNLKIRVFGGERAIIEKAIADYISKHPRANLHLYKTPNGYRILAMHQLFSPGEEDATELLNALYSDPLYIRMCKNQKCFRARISPKPWRIGIKRLGPRPGVWPIKASHLPARSAWIKSYEKKNKEFSSCRFIGKFGSDNVESKALGIKELHDHFCQSTQDLPLA
ncbi:hypothetical protein [Aliikangiella sp. G2MR2-5]|uniref:hypothetical protein n=1 Tax=Aliikangiella sp. G2MR2-5 TaxID=2788943 RepID=UPI0018AB39E6|nr:hypothetical protein [Aliikangiella sp. G2MR2-5]